MVSGMSATSCRWYRIRADGTRGCPECGVAYRALRRDAAVVAHFDYGRRRWCPGGKPPTPAQKAARKKKRSIRAASAGLPTLGR